MTWAMLAKSFAARISEIQGLKEKDVIRQQKLDAEGNIISEYYLINFDRSKRTSAREDVRHPGEVISGELEMSIIDAYIQTRNRSGKTCPDSSFWRYLLENSKGELEMTNKNVGINVTSKFGVDIATALKLDNAHRYTSHTFRNLTINIMASKNRLLYKYVMPYILQLNLIF